MRNVLVLCLVMMGCGGQSGESCTVQDNTIVCPDGTSLTVDDSEGNSIVSSIACMAPLQDTLVYFVYDVVMFSSGDVFAHGAIDDAYQVIGSTVYYASQQVGSNDAAVIFTYDLLGEANGGYWRISLNRFTLVSSIVYKDYDAYGGSISWGLSPSACVVNQY